MSNLRKTVLNLLYELGAYSGCHQRPDRSFSYKGHPFPVCARCTGVFFGQLAAVLINWKRRVRLLYSVIFLGIMGFDWGIQEAGIRESTNKRRLVTGFLGGFAVFNLYFIIIRKIGSLTAKRRDI